MYRWEGRGAIMKFRVGCKNTLSLLYRNKITPEQKTPVEGRVKETPERVK
jgi:hypothetical protein